MSFRQRLILFRFLLYDISIFGRWVLCLNLWPLNTEKVVEGTDCLFRFDGFIRRGSSLRYNLRLETWQNLAVTLSVEEVAFLRTLASHWNLNLSWWLILLNLRWHHHLRLWHHEVLICLRVGGRHSKVLLTKWLRLGNKLSWSVGESRESIRKLLILLAFGPGLWRSFRCVIIDHNYVVRFGYR